jgi:uncharacterized membrane protein
MHTKYVGAAFAFAFGLVILQFGFFQALFVAVLALLGWIIGKVCDGEIDVIRLLQRDQDLE